METKSGIIFFFFLEIVSKILIIQSLGKKFSSFFRNVPPGGRNCLLYAIGQSWRIFCFFSGVFWTLIDKFRAFWQTKSGRVVRTAFYVSMDKKWGNIYILFLEIFFKKINSSVTEPKTFVLLSKRFPLGCRNCFLYVIKQSWRNFCFIDVLWSLTDKFTAFCQKNQAGLSKLHSTCPMEHLRLL